MHFVCERWTAGHCVHFSFHSHRMHSGWKNITTFWWQRCWLLCGDVRFVSWKNKALLDATQRDPWMSGTSSETTKTGCILYLFLFSFFAFGSTRIRCHWHSVGSVQITIPQTHTHPCAYVRSIIPNRGVKRVKKFRKKRSKLCGKSKAESNAKRWLRESKKCMQWNPSNSTSIVRAKSMRQNIEKTTPAT